MANIATSTRDCSDDNTEDTYENETSTNYCRNCSLFCCVFSCLVVIFPTRESAHESYQDSDKLNL